MNSHSQNTMGFVADEWRPPSLGMRVLSRLVNPGGAPGAEELRTAVGGKTVLITGASFGIGEATARLLAGAGAKVLLVARSADKLEDLVNTLRSEGGVAEAWPADLADPEAAADLARRLIAAHGALHVVVNNAGKSIRRSLARSFDRFDDFERTMGVNYLGPVRLLLGVLPAMCAAGGGQVINISTIGARITPGPRWGAYQASKAAFDIWFRSVGVELAEDRVTTTSIYLGLVYTRMSAPTPSLRSLPGLEPAEAAGLVGRAIVRRPRVIAPWWVGPAELLSVALRRPLERLGGVMFRRSTDTARASGVKP